jgi:hypothetical protein
MKDFILREFEEIKEAMSTLDDENIHILSVKLTTYVFYANHRLAMQLLGVCFFFMPANYANYPKVSTLHRGSHMVWSTTSSED